MMKMPRFAAVSFFNAPVPSPTRTAGRRSAKRHALSVPSWPLASLLALGACGSVQAQTIVRSADLTIGIILSPGVLRDKVLAYAIENGQPAWARGMEE